MNEFEWKWRAIEAALPDAPPVGIVVETINRKWASRTVRV